MNKIYIISFIIISVQNLFAQNSMEKLLDTYNKHNIPYISVQELAMPKTKPILLDSRELKEFKVSHLKDAIHVGYDHFNLDSIQEKITDKHAEIVVYCSVGIRSETIGNKLKKAGYTNVKNLYGGIFEWKNNNFSVYNRYNKTTDSIHTFSKIWSKWLNKGIKVYE